ncbi:hypothetical protein [Pseudosulfitobacter koreensis]|uniref:HNH endonuclease n=1 Tax=Pseudosulfitobacter koreensis TaxID=2968472 RepID=A0ABT1Z3D6_9RHOB|nr:hypothetical protein [Pseudosulfitobacter koreense]MCR8827616.1 hypothetical protein [Pseudosulfitobacter koreense]
MNAVCDTSFAHAVRRAAKGIRLYSRADDLVEAGPLCAILCSDGELDQHGLELMALAVTGKLHSSKAQRKGETEFARAVRRANAVWRAGKAEHPSVAGASLAHMLRSGQAPFGLGERQELAELFSPKKPNAHNARKGRPPIGAGHWRVKTIARTVRRLKCKYGNTQNSHSNAVDAVVKNPKTGRLIRHVNPSTGERFTVSKRTVEKYWQITEKRKMAIEKYRNN